jgi:CubicO group peptidase (beta-lactamase class C family)
VTNPFNRNREDNMGATQVKDSEVATRVTIQGTCDERFREVRDVLARNLATGEDIGASAAVFIDGEPVVDIWGGYIDPERTRPWERDTIVNNFSTTKTMTALAALILPDRGDLDLDGPVVKYWPEFAAHGKNRILVRHLLGHTAALCGWTETLTFHDLLDWEKATTLLARQAPWLEIGTVSAYHPLSYGPLIGEVIRRVTGKTLKTFFAEEVARPLGADYHIGAPAECDARVSRMIQGSPLIAPTGDLVRDRAFHNPLITPQSASTIEWRRADLGGSNGHGNARSVARVQSVLSCGGEVGGVRLLSRAGCERALEVQADGPDRMLGFHLRWGMGYALENAAVVQIYGPRVVGRRIAHWGGSGGSSVVNDLDARMTVAYVMNRHLEHGGIDPRGIAIVRAVYEVLLGSE